MFKIKQKWGLAFLLLLSFAYVFIFLITLDSAKEDIKEIYFADRISSAHQILIDKYNVLNQGKIKVIPIDFSNYDFSTNERKELLARSLRGRGDGIDLLAVDIIWVERFAQWCEPLDQYFSVEEQNKLLDLTLKSCYTNGELLAVPFVVSYGIFFYREDLIRKLKNSEEIIEKLQQNITWNEFIKLGNSINLENPFYIFPAADYEGLICVFMELLLGNEPEYFKKWGFNFNTPSAEKALNLLVDLVNKHNLTPRSVTEFTEIPSYEYFLENDGLFIRGWQTYIKDFEQSPFDSEKIKQLRKMSIPRFEHSNSAATFGGWHLMVSKFSNNKPEVVDFVKFLISEPSQEIFYKEAGFSPIVKSFYEDDKYLEKYPEITKLEDIYRTGVHRPAHKDYTKYSEIISHYLNLSIKNEISVKEALEAATEDIKLDKMIVK